MADGDEVGRVLIAFDDEPLDPNPTWTRLDSTNGLVADIELTGGKQDEFDETETNKATVRLNDRTGDFDPNNTSGPYFGKLAGKQIMVQVYNAEAGTWHERFKGTIRKWGHDLNPATRAGVSIVSNVAIEASGRMDYLARVELVAGVFGDPPPLGHQDAVFYEDGEVDTRLITLLVEAGLDTSQYVVFSGNVMVQETEYDSGDSLLTAVRDAADAETAAALANVYEDRHGRVCFHGRGAKLNPISVSTDAGPDAWDYQVHLIGDGAAITGDPDFAQLRPPFQFRLDLNDVYNRALIIPRGIDRNTIPSLVEQDATSIGDYGPCPFPTYQDSINGGHKTNGDTAAEDCNRTAQYIVGNFKDPFVRLEQVVVKSVHPDDARAEPTWKVLCLADIADGVVLKVGYPGGDGIDDAYFIEGWTQTITPLGPEFDLIELTLNLSPQPTYDPYDD